MATTEITIELKPKRAAVRFEDGTAHVYEFNTPPGTHEEIRKLVTESIPGAKTILVEV